MEMRGHWYQSRSADLGPPGNEASVYWNTDSHFTGVVTVTAAVPSQHHSAFDLSLPAELGPIVADLEASQHFIVQGIGLYQPVFKCSADRLLGRQPVGLIAVAYRA